MSQSLAASWLAIVALGLASPLQAGPDADAMPEDADAILDRVVARLPDRELTLHGDLLVRRRHGLPVRELAFEMQVSWRQAEARATCILRDAFGTNLERLEMLRRPGLPPSFAYAKGPQWVEAEAPDLGMAIQNSDLSWLDLTLSFLWWRGGRITGQDTVRGRDCVIIEVPVPPGETSAYASARLWVDRRLFMLLQAEGLDDEGTPVRRLWVRSLKKVDEMWMIKDMEVQAYPAVHRTKVTVREVESPASPAAEPVS